MSEIEKTEVKPNTEGVKDVQAELPEGAVKDLLIPTEKYLKTGTHIGTRFKSGEMRRYIFKQRKDGLKVLDIQVIDERIRLGAHFLSRFDPKRIIVVAGKLYAQKPAQVFAESIGGRAVVGRFVPGTFTNPEGKEFIEPAVVIVSEPESDHQAINEAMQMRVPLMALASTNNSLVNVDFVIPMNNKGRKSLALVYWLLAREYLKNTNIIKSDGEFSRTPEDFEYQLKGTEEEAEEEQSANGRFGRKPFGRRTSARPAPRSRPFESRFGQR